VRYFVTGGAGGFGLTFAERARAAGDEVVALVRRAEDPRADALKALGVELAVGEVGDPEFMAKAAAGAEVVVHAAGTSDPFAPEDALAWLHIAGTENVMRAAEHAGCRRVVHLSCTDVTLHRGPRMNWDEQRSLPREPTGALAKSKQLAEEIALSFHGPKLEVCVLRPGWLWGGAERANRDRFVARAARYGVGLIGGGRAMIATTHLETLVDAVLEAAEESAAAGRMYYITDDVLESQASFFGAYAEALGLPRPRRGAPRDVAYAAALVSPNLARGYAPAEVLAWGWDTFFVTSRARNELGWTPRTDRSALFEALAKTRQIAAQNR
jgi:nucleoside-diphosphate-sugar epimerase